jgi:FkbM family methyltransferase
VPVRPSWVRSRRGTEAIIVSIGSNDSGSQRITVEMTYQGHPSQRWGHISYAQHGDDLFLINLFELIGIDKPSYLDIGAHHPKHLSNTTLLYQRGSRGVNVEANPSLFDLFCDERKGDVNVNHGIGPVSGMMKFYMFPGDGGRNTFSVSERDQIISEGHRVERELPVPVITINDLVRKYCHGKYPHLLTMDIEGLDFSVLESADFNDSKPEVICVETRRHQGERMKTMMSLKGYVCAIRLAENLIFVRSEHYRSLY